MQLLIRQRIFSWTDSYDVYDRSGTPVYTVKADFFALGHHIRVYDKQSQRQIGAIHEKLFRFLPVFEIEIEGRIAGTVRKEFSLFSPRYFVDFQNWEVNGNLFGWDYEITAGGRSVMTISKELLNFSDTYTLNYGDPGNEIPGLLLVLAIDAANCSEH